MLSSLERHIFPHFLFFHSLVPYTQLIFPPFLSLCPLVDSNRAMGVVTDFTLLPSFPLVLIFAFTLPVVRCYKLFINVNKLSVFIT